MTRSIIKVVAYDVPVAHHKHYANLKDKIRYCDSEFASAKEHQYLNLYNDIDSTRWDSCIEMDHVNFMLDKQELVYDSFSDIFLIYHIEDLNVFQSLYNIYTRRM